jgi:hypothetical protein
MAVVGGVLVSNGLADSTVASHFTDGPFPDEVCGVSGTTTIHGTSVVQERKDGFFFGGTFFLNFVADNGKSITISAAGPSKESFPVIDEQAGTVTIITTSVGLQQKVSITGGPTLIRDAGTVTFIDVFEYTGDPEKPVGDQISTDAVGLHGPHPILLGDNGFCGVVDEYLLDP